jgi:hypothetical protein
MDLSDELAEIYRTRPAWACGNSGAHRGRRCHCGDVMSTEPAAAMQPRLGARSDRSTWESWGRPLLARASTRSALEVLCGFFGADYPQLQAEQPPAALWNGDLCPLGGETRVARVVELAAQITAIDGQPGFGRLRREASRDRQESYFAHLRALLTVAAPLSADGWLVDLAPRPLQEGREASRPRITRKCGLFYRDQTLGLRPGNTADQ